MPNFDEALRDKLYLLQIQRTTSHQQEINEQMYQLQRVREAIDQLGPVEPTSQPTQLYRGISIS